MPFPFSFSMVPYVVLYNPSRSADSKANASVDAANNTGATPLFIASQCLGQIRGTVKGAYRGYIGDIQGPSNKDYSILGSILGSSYFGKLPSVTELDRAISSKLPPNTSILAVPPPVWRSFPWTKGDCGLSCFPDL